MVYFWALASWDLWPFRRPGKSCLEIPEWNIHMSTWSIDRGQILLQDPPICSFCMLLCARLEPDACSSACVARLLRDPLLLLQAFTAGCSTGAITCILGTDLPTCIAQGNLPHMVCKVCLAPHTYREIAGIPFPETRPPMRKTSWADRCHFYLPA